MPQRTLSGQSEASRENSGPPQASLPSSRRKEAKTKQNKKTIIPPNWCSIQHHLRAKKLINPPAWLLPCRAHTPYSFSALSPVEEQCPRRRGPPPERSSASPEYEVGVTLLQLPPYGVSRSYAVNERQGEVSRSKRRNEAEILSVEDFCCRK